MKCDELSDRCDLFSFVLLTHEGRALCVHDTKKLNHHQVLSFENNYFYDRQIQLTAR